MDNSYIQNFQPAQSAPRPLFHRSITQRFTLDFEYPVVFTRDVFTHGNTTLREVLFRSGEARPKRLSVYLDSGLAQAAPYLADHILAYFSHCAPDLQLAGGIEVIPGGERIKNDPDILQTIYRQLLQRSLDRHSYVVTVGGGAVLDLVGFAAATFHRGLRHVRIPTTVLAQNDAGIGVKNGMNAFGVKNLVGSFHPPWGVIIDPSFLDTLAGREKRAGLAEAVKVALIRDREFFLWQEENAPLLARFEPEALSRLIQHCAMLHLRQIATGGDPFESGSARPLDFGHWTAHKLETLSGNDLRHGEAVAIGIALDSRYSVLAGLLQPTAGERIRILLRQLGFTLWHPAMEKRDAAGRLLLLDGLREFQEHLGGDLNVTLLSDLGRGVEVNRIDPHLILQAVDWLRRG